MGLGILELPKMEFHFWQNAKSVIFGKMPKMRTPETLDFRASPKTTFAKNKILHIHLQPSSSSKGKNLYSHPISDFSPKSQSVFLGSVSFLSQKPLFSRSVNIKRPHVEEFSSTQGLCFLSLFFSVRLSRIALWG